MDFSTMDVANRNPTFGSSLLNDNFGRRQTDDDLDPFQLKSATEGSKAQNANKDHRRSPEELGQATPGQQSLDSLMLQNPNGATQLFTDMHGITAALEEGKPLNRLDDNSGMRHMGDVTAGGQRVGATDWGAGTDGGRSDNPQDGVPYGSFVGV